MSKLIVLLTLVCFMVLLPVASLGGCKQEPATLKYRDHLEMGVGGCEGVIFHLSKSDSWLENREVAYTLGILEDGEFKPLPELIEAGYGNWGVLGDEEMAKFQGSVMTVRTSPDISPGEYELGVQLEAERIGVIGCVPLTINVRASADDIVETPGGPTYRARVSGPGEEPWTPVEEQTVTLGTQGVQLDYRDFVEMKTGECKGILFTLHTSGTELESKDINYTVGMDEDDTLKLLPEGPLEIVEMWTYDSPPHQTSPVTVIFIGTCGMASSHEFNLGVQLEAEGIGVIGRVPLTINVIETADDIFGTPAGAAAYRAQVHGVGEKPWPPVEEKRLYLEAP